MNMPGVSENFVLQEWQYRIRNAYRRAYPTGEIPDDLVIMEGHYFDGAGGPGFVGVDQAVAAETVSSIRLFALAHETGHCVVCVECVRLGIIVPNTNTGANKKKHEMMADLVAMRVLGERLPSTQASIKANYPAIADRLGAGGVEHPSGMERTRIMKKYTDGAEFEKLFRGIHAGSAI
jgi:hypothetical protein